MLSRDGGCPDEASTELGSVDVRRVNEKDGVSTRVGTEEGGNASLWGGGGPGKGSGILDEKAGFGGEDSRAGFLHLNVKRAQPWEVAGHGGGEQSQSLIVHYLFTHQTSPTPALCPTLCGVLGKAEEHSCGAAS